MPKFSGGCVVSVCIDLTAPFANVQFLLDGVLIDVPELTALFPFGTEVLAMFGLSAKQQNLELNFGESPQKHKPSGYASIYEYAGKDFRRALQVWNDYDLAWRPVTVGDGHLAQSWDDWPRVVSKDGNEDLVRAILSHHGELAEELCNVRDSSGRRAIDGASLSCRKVMIKFLHFMGRYEFVSKTHKKKSSTSMVYIARDFETEETVAIKLMKNSASFRQELDSRLKLSLGCTYVIDVINSFNGDKDGEFRVECQRKGFGEYNYCIVMPAAQRNLQQILNHDHVAGRDWATIRRIVEDILQCVSHLHSRGICHGDLTPLNIMRNSKGKMILIDMDSSREFGSTEVVGQKYSSAFCPPEAINVDAVTGSIDVKFLNAAYLSQADLSLLSQPSFDMWALGVTLYALCAGEPLFLSSYGDYMLDPAGLQLLHDWDDALKAEKLEKITDPKARNMVSRFLCKDPQQRIPISAALAHPFVTGATPVRMVGDVPKYDVFISYRQASDAVHAERVHSMLTAEGLSVFWDKLCLQDGKNWEKGFCDGLVQSKAFICLISKDAVGHATELCQSFKRLTASSDCDNVLLEHQLALELRAMGLIEFIYPVFIGDKRSDGSHGPFDFKCYSALPDVVVSSVLEKLTGHLDRQALGVPLEPGKTVKQVVATINSNLGIKIDGDGDAAFEAARRKIVAMCRPAAAATTSPRASSPRSLLVARLELEKQQLRDELQVEKDRAEAEKDRAEADKQHLQAEKDRAEAEKQQLHAEKDRAEAEKQQLQAEKQVMRLQMEAEIAALRAQLQGNSQDF